VLGRFRKAMYEEELEREFDEDVRKVFRVLRENEITPRQFIRATVAMLVYFREHDRETYNRIIEASKTVREKG
jgi:hypothetical protein